ncbi:hypothetical protein C5B42_04530 [Candidatus Cerribacteria bacterium 'Amazon FNV 2010 28 9']|uniref:TIGR01906 family membrane protein n=1 Tax=Candidatus Cerribacteria bacterium 'Amazon FNV 2010 28 9' TaxID=2081795 RepID=A0A317JP89_9BACT|nr:MAG: hypothetical protein C5B42_04530 [Candidatus Cerribacteria bacterium 'Amazon FNV 2010 28 9']
MQRIVYTLAYVSIGLWWLFFCVSRLAFIQLLQNITFQFERPSVNADVVVEATQRAYAYSTAPQGGGSDIFFTADELSHLRDVEQIYSFVRLLLGVAAVASLSLLLVSVPKQKIDLRALFPAGIFLCGCALVAFLFVLFFSISFPLFHMIFFPQGNWQFPDSSLLIQLFPDLFWQLYSVSLMVGMLGVGILCFLLYRYWYE